MSHRVAVVSAKRTPIGKFQGAFSDLSAVDLGVAAARAALEEAGIRPDEVEETIFGMARQAGAGPNPARQVSVKVGVPVSSPAYTVNQACASGLSTLLQARDRIRLGEAGVMLVGGMESMTRVPYLLPRARQGYRLGHDQVVDGMYRDGFDCPLALQVMGETAETLAVQYRIPREEQDRYAARSQNRAEAAWSAHRFASEVVPLSVPARGGDIVVARDEHVRDGVTAESLAKLPAVFAKEGTVTAGNSSGITDGAAALVLLSEAETRRRNLRPLAWLEDGIVTGVDPKIMGIGPVPAVRALLSRLRLNLPDYDLVELNEAFAAQVLGVDRELHFDPERLNVNGGAIALGHPIGASGARITVTLLHELARRDGHRGLATLCVSGGMGIAVSFTRDS